MCLVYTALTSRTVGAMRDTLGMYVQYVQYSQKSFFIMSRTLAPSPMHVRTAVTHTLPSWVQPCSCPEPETPWYVSPPVPAEGRYSLVTLSSSVPTLHLPPLLRISNLCHLRIALLSYLLCSHHTRRTTPPRSRLVPPLDCINLAPNHSLSFIRSGIENHT